MTNWIIYFILIVALFYVGYTISSFNKTIREKRSWWKLSVTDFKDLRNIIVTSIIWACSLIISILIDHSNDVFQDASIKIQKEISFIQSWSNDINTRILENQKAIKEIQRNLSLPQLSIMKYKNGDFLNNWWLENNGNGLATNILFSTWSEICYSMNDNISPKWVLLFVNKINCNKEESEALKGSLLRYGTWNINVFVYYKDINDNNYIILRDLTWHTRYYNY